MKCSHPIHAAIPPFLDQKHPVRGVRGEQAGFPQPRQRHGPELPLPEVLGGIQQAIVNLSWDFPTVQQFIRDRFQGKQRRDLGDSDLITLLYHLQVAAAELPTPKQPTG